MPDDTAVPAACSPTPDQTPESAPDEAYGVGYGKPPKHTQFRKGQSGNPQGRPRRFPRNLARMFEDALNEKVTVVEENGRRRKITKREAIAKWLVNRAVQGDDKFLQTFLRLMGQMDHQKELAPPPFTIIRRGGDACP
jgi:hypothetical protein